MAEPKPTRRAVIRAGATAATALGAAWCCGDHASALPTAPRLDDGYRAHGALTVEVAPGLHVHPRDEWGADLPPRGPIASDRVEFLLVHHSASDAFTDRPRAVIRSVYAFHTGPQKRWPDVAYHFFVAPDGSVWEGRAGSLDGPVEASASGGNQGYAQLVCLLGNHVDRPPTAAAQTSLVRVLAWLADRYQLGVHRDASTTFVSRGSDRFPAGSTVTTPIISPHRSVTFTACPGDAAVALLPDWRRRVFDTLEPTWRRDGLQPARRQSLQRP